MALTEEQLAEAREELAARAKAKSDEYAREYARRQHEAEERHWVKMEAAYPGINRDTMYEIYSDMRDFYE
jgi:hypothetical protein